ncbi:hypothetical protein Cflav_PD3655 [Pedosphaera parvula Ellin514]|uniref:Uncharacterized protein n=1 Tax=Pedosphaera parvula (strain Ellin514) TaxID=320771 RepID=B9XHG2_PEDPL|nr:hypothetical protein Cflav_PD3655 [Pedosphaera parvula Ellin514]
MERRRGGGFIEQHLAEGFDGNFAVLGGVLMLPHGDGAEDEFGIGFGSPAERIESGGGLPTDIVIGVLERRDEGGDGAVVSDRAQGEGGLGANFGIAIKEECGSKNLTAAFVTEGGKGLGGSEADLGIFVLEGVMNGFESLGITSGSDGLDGLATRLRIPRLKPL